VADTVANRQGMFQTNANFKSYKIKIPIFMSYYVITCNELAGPFCDFLHGYRSFFKKIIASVAYFAILFSKNS